MHYTVPDDRLFEVITPLGFPVHVTRTRWELITHLTQKVFRHSREACSRENGKRESGAGRNASPDSGSFRLRRNARNDVII